MLSKFELGLDRGPTVWSCFCLSAPAAHLQSSCCDRNPQPLASSETNAPTTNNQQPTSNSGLTVLSAHVTRGGRCYADRVPTPAWSFVHDATTAKISTRQWKSIIPDIGNSCTNTLFTRTRSFHQAAESSHGEN